MRLRRNKYDHDQTLTAYHEAGHTVMATACGWRVKSVTIRPGKFNVGDKRLVAHLQGEAKRGRRFVVRGHTNVPDLVALGTFGIAISKPQSDRVLLLKWSLWSLGGVCAEMEYSGSRRALTKGQMVDMEDFGSKLGALGLKGEAKRILNVARMMTKRYWPYITAIAEALLEQETLTARKINSTLGAMPKIEAGLFSATALSEVLSD
jgi:hypothetical protein